MIIPSLQDADLSFDNGVAVLRMDRDDVRNALTGTALPDDIIAVCEWANAEIDVAALVLTGNGAAFSAGGNLFDIHEKKGIFGGSPIEIQESYRSGLQRMASQLYNVEVPTIAAVNGAAIGAGLDLACMCDVRIGAERARLGETFVNLGIIPGDGGAWFLPRIVGAQRAAELTFSGRILDAEEALQIGILLEVCSGRELLERCLNLAGQFASKPRHALRLSKRLLRASRKLELPEFLDYCASLQSLCHTTEEHRTAVSEAVRRMKG